MPPLLQTNTSAKIHIEDLRKVEYNRGFQEGCLFMLDLFRKQKAASKWILGIITGIMALGMAVFFIPAPTTVGTDLSNTTLAKVGKSEISSSEYEAMFRRFMKNSNYPKDIQFLKQVGVPKQLLDQMIVQKLLIQEAQRFGLNASDREVRDRILSNPAFQQFGGSINMDVYARVLQQSGTTIDEFESNTRDQIMIDKLRHLITDGIVVTPEEAEKYYRDSSEKVTLDYVLFDPAEIEKTTKVDEAALKKYFEANKEKFMTSEQRKARYALVDMNKIRENTKLTDDDLRQYYDQNRIKYFVNDRNRVSHILFKTQGKTPTETEAIRQKALQVLAKARAGADFAQLAKEYSEDSSKDRGGDLGWVDQNTRFVAEFKEVALSLGVGAISDLVTTQFGFHIIKVMDHQAAHTMTFDEAKDLIRPTLMAQKSDREGAAIANQIFSALSSKPQDIEAVAKQFGAEVRETPLFAAGDSISDIGSNPDFERAVFSTALNKVGSPVRVAPGFAIPEVVEIKPPHLPELPEVQNKVEAAYKKDKSGELAKEKAESFAKAAAAARNFDAAAKAAGLKSETSDPFQRNTTVKGIGNTQEISMDAFKLKVGDTSGALPVGPKYIVFRIKEKTEIKPEDFEKAKASVTAQLLNEKRASTFQTFQDELLARSLQDGKVKINEQALDTLVTRRLS